MGVILKNVHPLDRAGRGVSHTCGHFVAVMEDDRRDPIFWYQNSACFRLMEGAQIFLDNDRRTRCTVGPEVTKGLAPAPKPKAR